MSDVAAGTKRRWLASALAAGVLTVGVLALFRSPRPSHPARAANAVRKPSVTVRVGHDDELALRDLAPLFLPTSYNTASTEIVRREPGRNVFDVDTPRLRFTDSDPGLQLPAPFHAPAAPVEIVADSPGPLAAGIGRTDALISATPPHGAFLEVFATSSGESVLAQTLELGARPKIGDHLTADWRPLEFMAAVGPAGLVGQLVLTTGSGSEEVDNHFRNYLARTFRIGDRLTPGFYRIVVGP
jgi:hypothetical protein